LGKKDMKQSIDGRIVFYRHEEQSARITDALLDRLRFPRDFRVKVVSLIEHHMFNVTEEWSDAAVRRLIARVGKEDIEDLLALREADGISRGDSRVIEQNKLIRDRIASILESDAAFKIRDLAISGSDVMRVLDMPEGPEVGTILKKLLTLVLEHPERNSRDELISLVERMGNKE